MKCPKILMFLFNPQWNIVRVTSCGVDCLSENVKIVSTADGLLIRVR